MLIVELSPKYQAMFFDATRIETPVESRMGAVAYSPVSIPAHQTVHADLPHGFPIGFTSRQLSFIQYRLCLTPWCYSTSWLLPR